MRSLGTGTTMQLTRHFFRRFFQNDVLDPDGETTTTVARALGAAAAPGLMFAFFLQNAYPQRSPWGRIQDHYFFVLFSFVTMVGVAVFEWDMLFPEHLDFLVLTPLPLRPGQLLRAKAAALGALLGFFLLASNVLGILVLPAVSKGVYWRLLWAQTVAVGMAGVFGAMSVLAIGGLLLCVLPAAGFRRVSPVLQMLTTTLLVLLVIHYARFGDEMPLVLERPGAVARNVPTFWLLGVFERLLHGQAAEGFSFSAARRAWTATGAAFATAALLYPLAWARMQRMAVQGEVMRGRSPVRPWVQMQGHLLRTPVERAVFSFTGKTMLRNSRYQVYLAIYGGVGLALATACALNVMGRGGALHVTFARFGLRAVLPLLLFWTVAGLRMAFAFPQNLPARWIFRVTGADARECARSTRRWVMVFGLLEVLGMVVLLAGLGWRWRALLVQAVVGTCFCAVLVESFFLTQRGAPFTRPRSPGKTNFPAVLTLYVGVLPPLLFGLAWAEVRMERSLNELGWTMMLAGVLWLTVPWVREKLVWTGDESEAPDGEIQLLGLAGDLRA